MDPSSSDVGSDAAQSITDLIVCQACHADPIDISYSVWYCKPCSLLAYPPYDSDGSPTRANLWDTPTCDSSILCQESLSASPLRISPSPPPATPADPMAFIDETPPAPVFIDETPVIAPLLVDPSDIAALQLGDMHLEEQLSHVSDENYWKERIRANAEEVPAYEDKKAHTDAFNYVLARMKHAYLTDMLASKMSRFKEEKRRRRNRGTRITTAFKMVRSILSERK